MNETLKAPVLIEVEKLKKRVTWFFVLNVLFFAAIAVLIPAQAWLSLQYVEAKTSADKTELILKIESQGYQDQQFCNTAMRERDARLIQALQQSQQAAPSPWTEALIRVVGSLF